MGNCPTTPSEFAVQSHSTLCNGERMWTTFLFSSLFTLFGGWIIILLYDFLKALVVKSRRSEMISIIKRYSRRNEVIVSEMLFFFVFKTSNFCSLLQNE